MPSADHHVLIADDHHLVRTGLRELIDSEPGLTVVGEAENGKRAVTLFYELRPHIVIMDLRMPEMDGLTATRQILASHPAARVLMLSTHEGDDDIRQALNAGATGYVLKRSSGREILPALRAVLAGKRWLSADVEHRLATARMLENITVREREILALIAHGESNKEIASHLEVTEHTVKAHAKSLLSKLGVRNRTEAVTVALQRGIIHLPDHR